MQLAFYDSAVWEMHLQARFRRHYLSPSHRKQTSKHVPLKLTFATSAMHDRDLNDLYLNELDSTDPSIIWQLNTFFLITRLIERLEKMMIERT